MVNNNKIVSKKNSELNWVSLHRWFFLYRQTFVGSLIAKGKKLMAFKFFSDLNCILKVREHMDPFLIFLTCMLKITPKVLLRSLRLGGKTHGVPMPITQKKQISFAVQ